MAAEVGKGNSVNWPAGTGGKGREGVTGQVRQTPGAIGYVELTFAQQNQLPVAAVKNPRRQICAPDTSSTTAAIAAFSDQLSKDPRTSIVNAPATAPDAYPISTLTFLIVPKDGPDVAKRTALKTLSSTSSPTGRPLQPSSTKPRFPSGVKIMTASRCLLPVSLFPDGFRSGRLVRVKHEGADEAFFFCSAEIRDPPASSMADLSLCGILIKTYKNISAHLAACRSNPIFSVIL